MFRKVKKILKVCRRLVLFLKIVHTGCGTLNKTVYISFIKVIYVVELDHFGDFLSFLKLVLFSGLEKISKCKKTIYLYVEE